MAHSDESFARKEHPIDGSKTDRERETPGMSSEIMPAEQALDLASLEERLLTGVEKMRGKRLVDVFREDEG